MTLVVRSRAEPATVLERIRDEVRTMDAGLPLYDVKPMEEHLSIALAPARVGSVLVGSFGILALALASVGLYGILAFVAQRTFEIGVRRALGASRWDILSRVVRRGLTLALVGLVGGFVLSLATSRVLASWLYGIGIVDVAVFAGTSIVLLGTAVVASLVPARRALRIDPLVALRYE